MARLIVRAGMKSGKIYSLAKEIVTLGRDEKCAIRLDVDGVSRNHAQVIREGTDWLVTDLMSTNGTLVNGEKVDQRKLADGDTVKIGDVELVFSSEGGEAPAPAPSSSTAPAAARGGAVTGDDVEVVKRMKHAREVIEAEVGKVIIGQKKVIEQVIIALFCRGHGLIEGVPGLAKTLLVSTISKVLELDFKRIQFTPDLMPSDITGTEVLEESQETGERSFRFLKGPIFTNVLLADEINRTPPKTQAALLEAMQEYRVTTGGKTLSVLRPGHPEPDRAGRHLPAAGGATRPVHVHDQDRLPGEE